MRWLLLTALLPVPVAGAAEPAAPESYLYQPAYELDEALRGPAKPCVPQPGDIFLSTSYAFVAKAGHMLAWSGPPHHSGIVFKRSDGRLAVLEAGPFNTIWVDGIDLLPGLRRHDERGEMCWIRRRRVPLTAEQSARLTAWAEAQEGKRFAVFRLLGQLTCFRSRGPLRTYVLGGPHGERQSYFCSELVMETCIHVGLIDGKDVRPAATYPEDLFYDTSKNAFLKKHFSLADGWEPPARWVSKPPTP